MEEGGALRDEFRASYSIIRNACVLEIKTIYLLKSINHDLASLRLEQFPARAEKHCVSAHRGNRFRNQLYPPIRLPE
jgi:hypothetical protein